MIDFETYRQLYSEAREYRRFDMYVAERGWEDWMEMVPEGNGIKLLKAIYKISNGGIESMLQVSGFNLKGIADLCVIPYTTLQRWKLGISSAPEYTLMLMSYAIVSMLPLWEESGETD